MKEKERERKKEERKIRRRGEKKAGRGDFVGVDEAACGGSRRGVVSEVEADMMGGCVDPMLGVGWKRREEHDDQ